MVVRGVKAVAQARNGVGAFILQCKRLDFSYCDWAGSSKGMLAFLKEDLPAFARANPQIEIRVFPRPTKHPFVRGHFINGNEKAISVRNFKPDEILEKVNLLKQASGEKSKRQKKPVTSLNESVRGIWSPYHGDLKMV
ncbi:ribosomal protein, mitochondrial [Talaromyces pinophilus]|uniref:Large ribosomal subunit protein mL43 n=1 Tax=Talaromyces pinophilus TaxID=128442 RepID=A0A6V8H3J1_TALPI|nr:54S ribosomal protein L51 [Talaromyces pinophilus]KUL91059.1 hypothetical protein ZTR_00642 [Talaromyces verruculosus]PCG90362.1 Hypothetical protein PENO1_099630 [Penicillium occitanis (nom. inval.)]PCH00813.1 hypothetical protein PENOC_051420 [Penicillium occitanis (nom. inval.)]GAM34595.1 ribosomal protein, mitochondrial [Talaromyces pinophilus]